MSESAYATTVRALRTAGCVFAEEEADLLLSASANADVRALLIERRVSGEPLEQILGWVDFGGVRVRLRPGVFVPRQRSVLLVEQSVLRLPPGGVLVDLCCGSGAIAAAASAQIPRLQTYAVDIDPVAVACAADNLAALGGTALMGDLYEPLPAQLRGRVDVVVANAPYVPADEIALLPAEARDHEPRYTLDGGADGLSVARRVAEAAPRWLRAGGAVLVETSRGQAGTLAAAMVAVGLRTDVVRDDERAATAVVGVLAP